MLREKFILIDFFKKLNFQNLIVLSNFPVLDFGKKINSNDA